MIDFEKYMSTALALNFTENFLGQLKIKYSFTI